MKWRRDDIEKYEQARLYFDTLLIPVQPVNVDEIRTAVFEKAGFLETIASSIEERLMGRVMLLPTVFFYFTPQDEGKSDKTRELFVQTLQQAKLTASLSFAHIVFIVSDPDWAKTLRNSEFSVFFVSEAEDDNRLLEMIEKGNQFLFELWK